MVNKFRFLLMTFALVVLLTNTLPAFAGDGGGMPWDSVLDRISANLSGRTARNIIIIAIVVTGMGIMFGEGGGVFRKILYVVFGGVIISAAISWGLPFVGFAEAAVGPRRLPPPLTAWQWMWTLGVLGTLGTWLGLHMEAQERRRALDA